MIVADIITTLIQVRVLLTSLLVRFLNSPEPFRTKVAGAALVGTAESARYRGETSAVTPEQANDILLAGLCLQTVAFVIFILLLSLCVLRSRKLPLPSQLPKLLSILLFISSLLLLLRTTFRLAESAAGIFSVAASTEGLFGGLEYLPVVLTALLWVGIGLRQVLPEPQLAMDGEKLESHGESLNA